MYVGVSFHLYTNHSVLPVLITKVFFQMQCCCFVLFRFLNVYTHLTEFPALKLKQQNAISPQPQAFCCVCTSIVVV